MSLILMSIWFQVLPIIFLQIIEKYNKNVFTTTTIAGSSLITASYTITLQCII